MKATEAKLLAFLKKSPQFVIPIYQRTYSWTEKRVPAAVGRHPARRAQRRRSRSTSSAPSSTSSRGCPRSRSQAPLLVIDGQQRLTTVTLLLEALARSAGRRRAASTASRPAKLRNYYLLNPLEEGERHFKLLLSQTDKASLHGASCSRRAAQRATRCASTQNFELLRGAGRGAARPSSSPLCKGLAKLVIVDIALNRDQDNPQLIFESMNSTGRS